MAGPLFGMCEGRRVPECERRNVRFVAGTREMIRCDLDGLNEGARVPVVLGTGHVVGL